MSQDNSVSKVIGRWGFDSHHGQVSSSRHCPTSCHMITGHKTAAAWSWPFGSTQCGGLLTDVVLGHRDTTILRPQYTDTTTGGSD